MAYSAYDSLRAAIANDGVDARVEVNQRALIDKVRRRRESSRFFLLPLSLFFREKQTKRNAHW
jgi:hypothetical protein